MWKPHNVALYLFMPHLSQCLVHVCMHMYTYIYTHIHTHDMYRIIRLYKGLMYHMFIYICIYIYTVVLEKNTIPHLGSPHAHKKKKNTLPLTLIITCGTTTSQVPLQKKTLGYFWAIKTRSSANKSAKKSWQDLARWNMEVFLSISTPLHNPLIKNISSKNLT